jgi:hypothetical protein
MPDDAPNTPSSTGEGSAPGPASAWTRLVPLAWVLSVGVLVLAPIAGRVLVDGRAQLREASDAAEAGDTQAEIRHLGRAARFRLPLASHDEQALARLAELGRSRSANAELDLALALAAWREVRGALIGTRVVDVSDPALLAEANRAIVELMAREAEAANAPVARERWAEELEEDLAPRGRSLLAAACLVAWLGACVGLFVRGVDGKGRVDPVAARRWGVLVLVSLVAWILLM